MSDARKTRDGFGRKRSNGSSRKSTKDSPLRQNQHPSPIDNLSQVRPETISTVYHAAEIDEIRNDEPAYNRPRRRIVRGRSKKSTHHSRESPNNKVNQLNDTSSSGSLPTSPPSPPRSPPSPPRSPPSPSIQALHVPLVSTQVLRLRHSSSKEEVIKILTPQYDSSILAREKVQLENIIPKPPPTPPPTGEYNIPTLPEIYQGIEFDDLDTNYCPPKKPHASSRVVRESVSEPNVRSLKSIKTASTGIGYARYRRPGEGFLGIEFDEDDPKVINQQVITKANTIKQLVKDKRMGLPQAYSDHIVSIADEIIEKSSNAEVVYSRKKERKKYKTPEALANEIISYADKGEGVLKVVKSTKGEKSTEQNSEAAQHLEKMVKNLHCRHRMLRRLAEEIIAKRWKLQNISLAREGVPLKSEDGGDTAKEAWKTRRKIRKRLWKEKCRGKTSKKRKFNEKDLQLIYSNPMAKLKDIAKSYGGPETWKENDPLSKILNKVGVEKVEKCMKSEEEEEAHRRKRTIHLPEPHAPITIRRKTGLFPTPNQPDVEAHFGKSAMTIFISNYSRMILAPSRADQPSLTESLAGKHSFRMLNVDKTQLTNDFVDMWKRRSYAVGILLVIMTALLHCSYLCGPRMGDNYVTYAMVQSLSGWPWYTPAGMYGLIFLGYLFGGMGVIKTASATEHDMTVKEYFKKRKIKFLIWCILVLYFFVVWITRCVLWYIKIGKTEKEIRDIFQKRFFYNQLPSRLLYTQFLFSCCGSNGPGDYPDGDTIGWPKSCYVRVNTYEEYYQEPKPIEHGCSQMVYVYSMMGLTVICSLALVVLILAIVQPIYLYVYELFIGMRSKVPEPWLEIEEE